MTAPSLRKTLWFVAAVGVLAHVGLLFSGVWSFDPINYDDPQVLALAGDSSVREIVTEPLWYAYKPVYFLSVKFDALFGSATSGIAHVHNLFLHVVASLLLVVLLARLFRSTWIAGAVGILFAVHPVHVESVAWIASRKDLLSLVFVLLAHLLYRRSRDHGRISWAAPLLLLLGGLTKGTVWVWTGVLLLDELVEALRARREGEPFAWGRAALRLLPCAVISLGGIVLDATMAVRAGPGAVEHGVSTLALAAAMAGVHARYVFHVFVPSGLSIAYAVDPAGTWASPLPWVGLLLLAFVVGIFLLSWRRAWPIALFGAGLWLIGLAPVNNLWPRTSILMADRYLYVPAIGAYLLLVAAASRWRVARSVVVGAAAMALLFVAVARTGVFRDSQAVWADATAKEPMSGLAWIQRGHDAATRGDWQDATVYARRAIDLQTRPELEVRAWLLRTQARLGGLAARVETGGRVGPEELREIFDWARAGTALADALEGQSLVRTDAREIRSEALVLSGRVRELVRDPASALEDYEKATELWPENATARYNLATLLATTGSAQSLSDAEAHLRRALRLQPAFEDAALQLVIVLARQGLVEPALEELAHAERRHGRTPELLYMRARIYLEGQADVVKAAGILHELKRVDPHHPKASRLLGQIHMTRGRILLEQGRGESDRAKLRRALEEFDAAGRAWEGWWEPEVWAGDALVHLVRYRAARERYARALELSDSLAWLERLTARAALLEAARTARYAESDEERAEAARIVANALQSTGVDSVDLGYLTFHEELERFRKVAGRLDAPAPAPENAGRMLRAVALAATGDADGARRELRGVLTGLPADTEEKDILDAALLLRGMLRARTNELALARRDYAYLAERDPTDPLPPLRILELALREAQVKWSIARGYPDDEEGLAAAKSALDEAAAAVASFADAHPGLLSAGQAAAQVEIEQARYVQALRRLNGLRERYPREPSLWRGQSAVYVGQFLGSRDTTLLAEAARALGIALMFDPRDPQALLDASQVARLAGRMERAVGYAKDARNYELASQGPAARALAGLHDALGRQALEGGQGQKALHAAQAARSADPGWAQPWVLEGDVWLQTRKYDKAYAAYANALELEPLSRSAAHGMAAIHAKRALIYQLQTARLRMPPQPQHEDPEGWAKLDEEERRAAREAWQMKLKAFDTERGVMRRKQRRELESALRLDPDAEDAEKWRRQLGAEDAPDPEARRRDYQEADELYLEGHAHFEAGRLVKALSNFQRATDLFPDHGRALYYAAVTCHLLLQAPAGETEEEKNLEAGWWAHAFSALQALDQIDVRDRFPLRHRVRGQLNELRWRREGRDYARLAAVRAYERFLHSMEAAGRETEPDALEVRRRLKELN